MKQNSISPSTVGVQANTFDGLIQNLVEKALLNVSEPLLEEVVERVISRKMASTYEDPMDIDQAAAFLKKAKQTIYGYCSRNQIPYHYSGGAKLVFSKQSYWTGSKRNNCGQGNANRTFSEQSQLSKKTAICQL